MSTRRKPYNLSSSRPKTSVDSNMRTPRHVTGAYPQVTYATYPSYISDGSNSHYEVAHGPTDFYAPLSSCWTPLADTFYPGSDSAHIPTLSVAPGDLSHHPVSDASLDSIPGFAASSASSTSIDSSVRSSISPPMSGAEMAPCVNICLPELDSIPFSYSHYPDPSWNMMPPTPPLFPDTMELLDSGKTDPLIYDPLSSPIQECEYLGVSKLQFARIPPRTTQHRPLRSASERSYSGPPSGPPEHYQSKDEQAEKPKVNPRNDPRYEAKPDKDGFYHCPFVRQGSCNHKPTKQKCYYAKNLDSHLKPYTCKFGDRDENCRSLRFSSNACLFRHEREMHGMHNHGMNPYLCVFRGCERARPDNGFPRRWNQRDHMKRVHGWDEPDSPDDGADRLYTDASRRKKAPGVSNSVAMKRTGSSRTQSGYSGQNIASSQRNISASRYLARAQEELQAHNIMIPGMQMDDVAFPSHQMLSHSPYPNGIYMQAAY